MTTIENQICALRELVLAKLAFDRAQVEFETTLPFDTADLQSEIASQLTEVISDLRQDETEPRDMPPHFVDYFIVLGAQQ